jgi:Right handed beta helix region
MERQYCKTGSWLIAALLWFSCVSAAVAAIPPCGSDPKANTLLLQNAIDQAPAGSTLELPSGVCVLATSPHPLRHNRALHIDNKSKLTLAGAEDGTSVLKLDPHPPRSPSGDHAYCGATHVLSMHLSQSITLRDFTIDGSDGELPEDPTQCKGSKRINERMFNVYVVNATHVTIDRMKLIKAHGDGLYMMAERKWTTMPFTENIAVTNTEFLANDRSGITFQRNVGKVSIVGNYFRNSGGDQDLDMEPSGGAEDRGPYDVVIDNNVFERLQPKLTVSLGAGGGTQRARDIRFTKNTIRASPLAHPQTGQGGCIFVYTAEKTTIAHNTIIGAQGCVTIRAQKVTDLVVEQNHVESFANLQQDGRFRPQAVVDVSARVVNQGPKVTCGQPPQSPCYVVHYPDRITVRGNTLMQHVRHSQGVQLIHVDASGVDPHGVTDNIIEATNRIAPVGTVDPSIRAIGIDVQFGVPPLNSGAFREVRTVFQKLSISGNQLRQFADGVRILHSGRVGIKVKSAVLTTNVVNTHLTPPRGMAIEGAVKAPQVGFITALRVDNNKFGCGFSTGPTPPAGLPPHAYVRPSSQAHTGNIGALIPCQGPGVGEQRGDEDAKQPGEAGVRGERP